MRLPLFLAALCVSAPLAAGEAPPPPPPPAQDTPPLPTGRSAQEGIEPEVTIIRRQDRTLEEYRLNGQLYMIKVTPAKGPSYYLMDADGDGQLETRRSELDPRILVPSWVIFRW